MHKSMNNGARGTTWTSLGMLIPILALGLSSISVAQAAAKNITIIQVSDLHGNLVPHAGIIENIDGSERVVTQGGGMAKVATVIKSIRASNANNLTLGVGDTIHGSAETIFTFGDAIMPALNALGLDAYTPGNWEFAYGPAAFRHRFTACTPPSSPCPPIPANARVMTDADGVPMVTKATFPTLAMNLYNGSPLPLPTRNRRPLAPYKIFNVDGVSIAVIGITASIVPQQPDVFSRTFKFTQGYQEMPGMIAEVQEAGAEIIIVQSELGLPQNVQLGREFADIDIILSAHSHEVTLGAILADAEGYEMVDPQIGPTNKQKRRVKKGAAIVVEAGEDLYIGRLDIKISNRGKIKDFAWEAIPVDNDVVEDPVVKALVDQQEEFFIAGADGEVSRHSFLPAGFCPGNICGDTTQRGMQLVEGLDTVIGKTDVLLHRHESLEGVMNNFIADSFRYTLDSVVSAQTMWDGVDMSMTNGFRFDTTILPADMVPAGMTFRDGRAPGEITLRDFWSYFPVAPALVAADFAGVTVLQNLDGILANIFSGNPFNQRGGWYLGLSSNLSQQVDVVNRPFSTSGYRIVEFKVNGQDIDLSKRYVMGSCYGHTFPIGRVCRAEGGANTVFFEMADPDDYASPLIVVPPVNSVGIIDNKNGGPIRQAAPDRYIHPVKAMRRFMDSLVDNTITEAEFGIGRVVHVDSTANPPAPSALPESNLPGIVQPIDGIGPDFLKRTIQIVK